MSASTFFPVSEIPEFWIPLKEAVPAWLHPYAYVAGGAASSIASAEDIDIWICMPYGSTPAGYEGGGTLLYDTMYRGFGLSEVFTEAGYEGFSLLVKDLAIPSIPKPVQILFFYGTILELLATFDISTCQVAVAVEDGETLITTSETTQPHERPLFNRHSTRRPKEKSLTRYLKYCARGGYPPNEIELLAFLEMLKAAKEPF